MYRCSCVFICFGLLLSVCMYVSLLTSLVYANTSYFYSVAAYSCRRHAVLLLLVVFIEL